jgi:uncharacterized membrane protein YdbT with pleckstrin-like domain
MNKYIQANLTKDEKVVMEAKFNFLTFIPAILMFIVSLIILLVGFKLYDKLLHSDTDIIILKILTGATCFWLGIVFPLVTTPIGSRLAITNKRVLGKRGILSLSAVDYPIQKIDQIRISASLFGRIFHYSTLVIKGTSDSGPRNGLGFYGVSNAIELKNCLNDALDKYAEEARKAQAEEIANAMHTQK